MSEGASRSLAVLIDADNASARYAEAIFEEIAKYGEANVRRIYGDFSSNHLSSWNATVQKLAILQHQQRNNTTGKNAADIALVIDAMDLVHRGGLDGFCLVNSDSDFTLLAERMREEGVAKVYGFGQKKKTSKAFCKACSQFRYVEKLTKVEGKKKTKKDVKTSRAAKKEPPTNAVPMIRKAMGQAWNDGAWVNLSVVGKSLRQLALDVKARTYGCKNLVTVVEKTGKFEIERRPGGGVRIKRR